MYEERFWRVLQMSLKIFNDIIALLANALRFYALKYFVGIFVQKEESRWKHVSILYIIGWAWTSAISLLFSSPAMNILSNITSLFLIFFPYRIKKTKKCLAVFVIYVIIVSIFIFYYKHAISIHAIRPDCKVKIPTYSVKKLPLFLCNPHIQLTS